MLRIGHAKAAVYSKKSINEIPKRILPTDLKKTNSAPDYPSERSLQNYSIGIFTGIPENFEFRIQFYFLKL